MEVKRISLLGVPLDIFELEDLEKIILDLEEKEGQKQIIFLSVWDLLRARRKNEYSECVRNADLIIPTSKSILKGAKFLHKDIPVRHNPFTITINILNTLESRFKSVYLFGGKKKSISVAEKNVHNTFKNLQIVGRYVGNYSKNREENIVQAIRKASPSLVLYSEGIKEKDCWSYRRRENFAKSIFLYYHDIIGIFSERRKRVSEEKFETGKEIWFEIGQNPLKIFLIFPFLKYEILLVWYRLFKKDA